MPVLRSSHHNPYLLGRDRRIKRRVVCTAEHELKRVLTWRQVEAGFRLPFAIFWMAGATGASEWMCRFRRFRSENPAGERVASLQAGGVSYGSFSRMAKRLHLRAGRIPSLALTHADEEGPGRDATLVNYAAVQHMFLPANVLTGVGCFRQGGQA